MSSPKAPARIALHDLSYNHPDGTGVFSHLSLAIERGVRFGLVGENGSGKTTLLEIIAGKLQPQRGRVEVRGTLAYVPQREAVPLDTDAAVWSTMSGGERMRARLLQATRHSPAWLLLDEPTNHLDAAGKAFVHRTIRERSGGLIAASHDRGLLALVDEILEIRGGVVRRYAMPFAAYEARRAVEDAAAQTSYASAQARVKRERRDMQDALRRAARSQSGGRKSALKTGVSKMQRGAMQRSAQQSAGRELQTHASRVASAQLQRDALRGRVFSPLSVAIDLRGAAVPARKVVARCERFNPVFEDGPVLWKQPLSLEILGPQRLHVAGANGSGKTLLLRHLYQTALVPAAYLDQDLSLLDARASLAEAMRNAAPAMPEHERRIRLGRLGFEQERALVKIGSLSGGERVRAAFGVLFAGRAPQLLVLDEPTNTLDAAAVDELVEALCAYGGALAVASHDRSFIDRIDASHVVELPVR
ncbi:MAG TPA: ATP-binding cassette domain-containing protein [Candidatus Baltobacteraceae bacterium]|jgi:ATPase subunit of ABC transporter with duplicated ATPase domains|nr:ATP-binding cassette domain-containing protein [Candidatus Baltobacteraceae bacterium]